MLATFFSALPVFGMILAGYAAARTGVIPASANRDLNRFVVWIALPALMFSIIAKTDWRATWDSGFAIASLAGSFCVFALGLMLGRMRGLPVADIAVDGLNASYSNAAYLGLPLFTLVLGPWAAPYIIVAATMTLMVLFAVAIFSIELGHHRDQGLLHALARALAGVIRNPIMIGSILGLLWWLGGVPLPDSIGNFTRLLGAAASPTALVAIGLMLAERPLKEALASRPVIALTAAKLVAHPAITAIIAYFLLGMTGPAAGIAVAIAALPTGTGPFMVAGFYARDGKVTSGTILLSTVLSMATITVLLHFLSQ